MALFALSVGHGAAAEVPPGSWYAAARLGATYLTNTAVTGLNLDARPLIPAPANIVKYKPGWTGSIAGGLAVDDRSRLEIEIGEIRNSVRRAFGDPTTVPGFGLCAAGNPNCASVGPTGGSTRVETYMAQGYYDFSTPWLVTPFLGVGIGIANIHEKQVGQPRGILLEGSTASFAYDAIGGFAFKISPGLAVDIAYRYLGTTTQHFRSSAFGTPGADVKSHAMMIGMRYGFL